MGRNFVVFVLMYIGIFGMCLYAGWGVGIPIMMLGPCIGVGFAVHRQALRERGFYLDRSDMPPENPFGGSDVFNNSKKE